MPDEQKPKTRTEESRGYTYEVQHVLTDSLGNEWWGFVNPLKMPPARAIAAELAAEWANLNMTKDDALAFIAKLKEQGDAGRIVDMYTTLGLMEQRLQWACEGRTMLELAKVYYLINDEPIGKTSEPHDKLKEAAFAADSDCRGFFLQMGFVLTKGFSEFSGTDIHAYLKAQEVMAMRLQTQTEPSATAPSTGTGTSPKFFSRKPTTSTRRLSSSVEKSQAKSTGS